MIIASISVIMPPGAIGTGSFRAHYFQARNGVMKMSADPLFENIDSVPTFPIVYQAPP
jgi:hypothetical protein